MAKIHISYCIGVIDVDTSAPYVDIITRAYKRTRVHQDSIKNLVNQTHGNFELLIIDDASPDDTRQIVTDINNYQIAYIFHNKNEGAPAPRNIRLAAADGDIMAFQDSDDEWAPLNPEKRIQAFQQASDGTGVVYTGTTRTVRGEDRYIPYYVVEQIEGKIRRSLARQNFTSTQAAAVRTECFDAVGNSDEDA